MKNAGADILVAGIENTGMRTLMDEAKRQGLDVIPCSRTANDNAELTKQGNVFDDGYLRVSIRSFQANPNMAQEMYREHTDKIGGQESESAPSTDGSTPLWPTRASPRPAGPARPGTGPPTSPSR
jgi:hypothetical protein